MKMTRKVITLPNSLWAAITLARKSADGPIPSEAEMVRVLLREALAARDILIPDPTQEGG
jgi:hypothetical protein